jgi:hypothetical protein
MERIYVAAAVLAGGLCTALLGWLESGEPFDPRKFGGSVLRAIIAAIVFAVGFQLSDGWLTVLDLFYAFLGGAGVDVLGNRVGQSMARLRNCGRENRLE